jgi:hypothetical protein
MNIFFLLEGISMIIFNIYNFLTAVNFGCDLRTHLLIRSKVFHKIYSNKKKMYYIPKLEKKKRL